MPPLQCFLILHYPGARVSEWQVPIYRGHMSDNIPVIFSLIVLISLVLSTHLPITNTVNRPRYTLNRRLRYGFYAYLRQRSWKGRTNFLHLFSLSLIILIFIKSFFIIYVFNLIFLNKAFQDCQGGGEAKLHPKSSYNSCFRFTLSDFKLSRLKQKIEPNKLFSKDLCWKVQFCSQSTNS